MKYYTTTTKFNYGIDLHSKGAGFGKRGQSAEVRGQEQPKQPFNANGARGAKETQTGKGIFQLG